MEYSIEQRLAGTSQAYWILRVWAPGQETPTVHTGKGSKGLKYVSEIRQRRYPNAKPRLAR
jgi:hypothetical protein